LPKRPICASPRCWKRSTRYSSRICSRKTKTAATRACAPIVKSGACRCAQHGPAARLSGALTTLNAAIPAPSARPTPRQKPRRSRRMAKLLGEDMGEEIRVFKGRFGPYVQRGPRHGENKKPPRQSVPKDWPAEELELERAVMLLSLPRRSGRTLRMASWSGRISGATAPTSSTPKSTSNRGGTNANLEGLDEVFHRRHEPCRTVAG